MSRSSEIILTTTLGEQSNHISVLDLSSCTSLLQLNDDYTAAPGTLCPLRQEYVYVGIKGKPLLYRWSLTNGSKSKILKTQTVAGHISAMCVSPDGIILAAAIDERIFVWQCNSGDLLAILVGPSMSAINQLDFIDQSCFLVSASLDGVLAVWSMEAICSLYSTDSQPAVEPVFTVSPCASPIHFVLVDIVTDILIIVVGEDGQFSVYSLASGRQLEDQLVPSPCSSRPLYCVTSNMLGEHIFCGSTNGVLLSTSLAKRHPDYLQLRSHRIMRESNVPDNEEAGDVKCIDISPSGQCLACGTSCGHVVLLGLPDLLPYQRVRLEGPVVNLRLLWRPSWLDDSDSFHPISCVIHPLRREPGLHSSYTLVRPCAGEQRNEWTFEDQGLSLWPSMSSSTALSKDLIEENEEQDDSTENKSTPLVPVAEFKDLQTEVERLREANKYLHRKLLETITLVPDSTHETDELIPVVATGEGPKEPKIAKKAENSASITTAAKRKKKRKGSGKKKKIS